MVLGIASVHLAETLRSSTFKLALIAIGLFGFIVLTLFGYVYLSTASYVRGRSDFAISAEEVALRRTYDRGGRDALIAVIQQRASDEGFQDNLYLLADPSYSFVTGNLKNWPPDLTNAQGWQTIRLNGLKSNTNSQPLLRAVLTTLPGGDHLLVGKYIDDLDDFAGNIRTAFIWGIVLVVILAGAASLLVTRRTVGRLAAINMASRAIMQSGLDKRIPLRGTRDEWDRVAENLNSMLDRIETLMQEVKQVTDNVAHDLRTPLARIRGRLEKAYHRSRDRAEDHALIGDTISNLDAVLRIFLSITRIAQIEAKSQNVAFRSVNVTEITRESVELYDAAAEEKGTHLNFVGDQRVCVTGDRDLIFDAVSNLIDNAIKHGPPAGHVTVEVRRGSDGIAIVSIADDGPGIPVAEHENVFKRFYRLERSRHTSGNGLGLSLVAAVARLHGARIEMCDNVPGLSFYLLFPMELALPPRMGAQEATDIQQKLVAPDVAQDLKI